MIMKNKLLIIIPTLLIFIGSSLSLSTQAAVELPNSMNYEGIELNLNGQGTRTMFFVKIYESGLYLDSANSNGEEVTNQDSVMAIRLDVLSSMLTADSMKKAINDGFVKSTNDNTQPIADRISQFMATLNDAVAVDDVFEFVYLPGSGVDVTKNSKHLDTIAGLEFKKAFFGIWLSDNPIQKSLKKAMLGN
jgi:hypothetical protein